MAAILFLDFDGVLHPDPPNVEFPLWSRSELLQEWLDRHADIDVVVSSTWRNTRTLEEIQCLLPPGLARRIVGVTPKNEDENYTRQVECESWMRQHRDPWVQWIALDDRSWNFRPFEKRLVLTNRATGLVSEDLARLDVVV